MVLPTDGFTEKLAAKRIGSGFSVDFVASFFESFGLFSAGSFVDFAGSDFGSSLRCASSFCNVKNSQLV